MKKFQKMFIDRMKKTIDEWQMKKVISNQELYRFLHSLKGTSASIGLDELSSIAESLLEGVHEKTQKEWTQLEWEEVVKPVIYFLENVNITNETLEENNSTSYVIEHYVNKLILIIEDDVDLIHSLKDQLEGEGYQVIVATNLEKGLSNFYYQKPDCVLMDMYVSNGNGIDVQQQIFDNANKLLIPVIVMSTDNKDENRIKAYEFGAINFLPKPLNMVELITILNQRMKSKDSISSRILRDELTGAYNRKFFQEEIERQLSDFKRNENELSLVILDIDFFKKVNDSYGHDVGDKVLKQLSTLVVKNKRKNDYFIRYGGEEFMLLMPHTDAKTAKKIVERHLQKFSLYPFTANEIEFRCTFSAGVVSMKSSIKDEADLVKKADIALYQAKNAGRNQVVIFDTTQPLVSKEKVVHIGIVDDDPVILQLLTEHLSKMNFPDHRIEIKGFREGESFFASNWHKKDEKYILLLDGIMPRMDGIEILRKIREQYRQESNIVIMLTARKKDQDIVNALQLGADDYMTKPFSLAELEARIQRFVQRLI